MGILSALFPSFRESRSPEERDALDQETARLSLYHFASCPFCLRVRWALGRMGLDLELRDIHKSRERYRELVDGGGKQQVPCLRIESEEGAVEWLYESDDIVAYLRRRFSTA